MQSYTAPPPYVVVFVLFIFECKPDDLDVASKRNDAQ